MATQQQTNLTVSCPHQDWGSINPKNCDFHVRRSHVNPREAHVPEVEAGQENAYGSLTAALRAAFRHAREYKDHGDRVHTDVAYGVHLITPPGKNPFYLFVEFVDRTGTPSQSRIMPDSSHPVAQAEFVTQTVRVEKRGLKVLKAIAERNDRPVNELLEEIIATSLDGKSVFDSEMMQNVTQLKALYGIISCDTDASPLK